jgi:hypothetical protein
MSFAYLTLSFLGAILSLGGGGIQLPPFKSLPWLTTPEQNISLFGNCPRIFNDEFFTMLTNWQQLQTECKSIFNTNETIRGRMESRYEVLVCGLLALGILFTFCGIISKKRSNSRCTFSIVSLLVQSAGVGIAYWQFVTIRNAMINENPIYGTVGFGYGAYIGLGACAFLLFGAVASKGEQPRQDHFGKWQV